MQMLVDAQLPMPQLRRLLAQLLSHEQPQSRSELLCTLMAQLAPHRLTLCQTSCGRKRGSVRSPPALTIFGPDRTTFLSDALLLHTSHALWDMTCKQVIITD